MPKSMPPAEAVARIKAGEPVAVADLDSFTAAYFVAALWSSNDESDPETGGEPMDSNYDWDDLAPATQVRMILDCAKFQDDNAALLADAIATGKVRLCGDGSNEYAHAGHDFWLTREGHGAGFWDGDWPQPYGDALTEAAKAYGEGNLYVGDDGSVYQMGAEDMPEDFPYSPLRLREGRLVPVMLDSGPWVKKPVAERA